MKGKGWKGGDGFEITQARVAYASAFGWHLLYKSWSALDEAVPCRI